MEVDLRQKTARVVVAADKTVDLHSSRNKESV